MAKSKKKLTILQHYEMHHGKPSKAKARKLILAFCMDDKTILPDLVTLLNFALKNKMPRGYFFKQKEYGYIASFGKYVNKKLTAEQIKELAQLTLGDLIIIGLANSIENL